MNIKQKLIVLLTVFFLACFMASGITAASEKEWDESFVSGDVGVPSILLWADCLQMSPAAFVTTGTSVNSKIDSPAIAIQNEVQVSAASDPVVRLKNLHDLTQAEIDARRADFPEEGIAIQLQQNVAVPIASESVLTITGQVDVQHAVPETEVKVRLIPAGTNVLDFLESNNIKILTTALDTDGKFTVNATAPNSTGIHFVQAGLVSPANDKYVYSNIIRFYLKPNFSAVNSIRFDTPTVQYIQGSKSQLPLLIATFVDGSTCDVSSLMYGTTYSIADSSIARILPEEYDGRLEGLTAGVTTLTASFMGQQATTTLNVMQIEELPSISLSPLPQNPVALTPDAGSNVQADQLIVLTVTPFDESQSHEMYASAWTIKEADTGKVVALLKNGTENYAEWIPDRTGNFVWSMRYYYLGPDGDGETESTVARSIVVTN